jgi:uncharacterized protein (DUF433 family)
MQLEDYFDFLAPNDIRVRGTRIGIETVLVDYLENGLYAEEIAVRYPTLTLEQTYATLAYYWRNRAEVDAYLQLVESEIEEQRRKQEQHPSPAVKRLRELAYQRNERSTTLDRAVTPA